MADTNRQHVFIVTDDDETREVVGRLLPELDLRGRFVSTCDAEAALDAAREWDLAVLDGDNGDACKAVLGRLRTSQPELPIILLGGSEALGRADRCLDRLDKPVSEKAFRSLLDTLLPSHDVPLVASAEDEMRVVYQIAGNSQRFMETVRLARKVAPTSMPVLITGESGTGKELISQLIHRESNRTHGPLVHLNCAALSESLLESELFGHEKGAFTGATHRQLGRFERAHGGTLLLDEISETGDRLQAELLRVLEQQDFERVGGSESVRVNVRVISTSNRNLHEQVEKGRFRRDLYYRLGGIHLMVPPLRERKEDIPSLVWHFVNQFARETRRRIDELDPQMLLRFQSYNWPGNIRELRNIVRTALVLGDGPMLTLDGVPANSVELPQPAAASSDTLQLQELERQAILEALRRTKRNQTKAARLLGISDRTLRDKIRKYRQVEQPELAGDVQW